GHTILRCVFDEGGRSRSLRDGFVSLGAVRPLHSLPLVRGGGGAGIGAIGYALLASAVASGLTLVRARSRTWVRRALCLCLSPRGCRRGREQRGCRYSRQGFHTGSLVCY